MAAIDNYILAQDAQFKARVGTLSRKVALFVIGETGIPEAAIIKRQALATRCLYDYQRKIESAICSAVTSLGTLTEDSATNDIEYTINSIFNDMAGVSAADLGLVPTVASLAAPPLYATTLADLDNYQLSQNKTFRAKVNMLCRKSALAVIGEINQPIAAIVKRQALATRLLYDYQRKVEGMFSMAIASLGTLNIDSTDNDIEFTINAVFNDMAGVSAADLTA